MDRPVKNEPEKLLLNSREAAVCLGISTRTLWTLTKSGQIPSVKIGKSVRYPISSLKKWVDEQENQQAKHLPR